MCAGAPIVVVGGGNSAGQAAMFLAEKSSSVCIVVRRPLAATMSKYLVDRIESHPRVKVHVGTTVTALHGEPTLQRITVAGPDAQLDVDCTALFSFIGAEPNSAWLDGVAVDEHGFVLTDRSLDEHVLGDAWSAMGRRPLALRDELAGPVRRRRSAFRIDQACRRRGRGGLGGDPLGARAPRAHRLTHHVRTLRSSQALRNAPRGSKRLTRSTKSA